MTWETGQSLLDYGLRRANELSVEQNQDFVPDLKDYINLAYWDIVGEFPWLWAIKYPPYQLTTVRSLVVGASVVADSLIATLGADPGSVLGRKIMFDADGIPLRIANQAGVSLTLAAPSPVTQTGPAIIYQDEYQVPADLLMPLQLMNRSRGGEVDPLTRDLFTGKYGYNNTGAGWTRAYTYVTDQMIQLGPWPMDPETFELTYTYLPPQLDFSGAAATDTPILPINIRWIIPDRALLYLLTDMEDTKGQAIIANASIRLNQEKDRHAAKWRPQFWIPRRFRIARNR